MYQEYLEHLFDLDKLCDDDNIDLEAFSKSYIKSQMQPSPVKRKDTYYYMKVDGSSSLAVMIEFCFSADREDLLRWEEINWEWSSPSRETHTRLNDILDQMEKGDSLVIRRLEDLSTKPGKIKSVCKSLKNREARLQLVPTYDGPVTVLDFRPLKMIRLKEDRRVNDWFNETANKMDNMLRVVKYLADKKEEALNLEQETGLGLSDLISEWNELYWTIDELKKRIKEEKCNMQLQTTNCNYDLINKLCVLQSPQNARKSKLTFKTKFTAGFSRYIEKLRYALGTKTEPPSLADYTYIPTDIDGILQELLRDREFATQEAPQPKGRKKKVLDDYPPLFLQYYYAVRIQHKHISFKDIAADLSRQNPAYSITGKQVGVWFRQFDAMEDAVQQKFKDLHLLV